MSRIIIPNPKIDEHIRLQCWGEKLLHALRKPDKEKKRQKSTEDFLFFLKGALTHVRNKEKDFKNESLTEALISRLTTIINRCESDPNSLKELRDKRYF